MAMPFVDHIGMRIVEAHAGRSTCTLEVQPFHFNSTGVVHGGALFTLADTGIGAALYPTLAPDEFCATIEMKINYFKPVTQGPVECTSHLINRGKTVAHLEANLVVAGTLVAKASANFAILQRKGAPPRAA